MQDVAIKQLIKPGNLHLRMFEKVQCCICCTLVYAALNAVTLA